MPTYNRCGWIFATLSHPRKINKNMSDITDPPESSEGPEGPIPPTVPDSGVSSPDWDIFGVTPRYLAAGLCVPPELLLTTIASTLGGPAGPFARVSGFFGERHAPANPLVLVTVHPGRARHFEQLACAIARTGACRAADVRVNGLVFIDRKELFADIKRHGARPHEDSFDKEATGSEPGD